MITILWPYCKPAQSSGQLVSLCSQTFSLQKDSITDVTHSEGEVHVQDPMAVLLSRIQNHMRSAENSMVSEGELLTEHLRTPGLSQDKRGKRNDGETGM